MTWFIRQSAERADGRLRETLIRSFGRLETMDARLFKDRTMAFGPNSREAGLITKLGFGGDIQSLQLSCDS